MSLLSLCASAHNTVFSFLKEPLSLPFSLSMASFVSKKCRYAKNLHQPLEPFQLKLILSYKAHRTFSSKWHLQANNVYYVELLLPLVVPSPHNRDNAASCGL